jgi:RNA polymerase sigma factor (sigma-70 family)
MSKSVCVSRPREKTPTEVPVKRVPVTQEFLATSIAADAKGDEVQHPARDCFTEALFNSIHDMVYKLADTYRVTCHEEIDDLAQDCFCRIVKVLPRFNPKQAKFTTWAWHVCKSVLNSKYRRNIKRMKDMVRPYEGFEAEEVECDNTVFKIDFADALRDLREAYPERTGLIHEIFGNPDDGNFVVGTATGMKVAAEKAGMEYAKAYYFYSKVVKPFLRKRLDGYGDGGEDE